MSDAEEIISGQDILDICDETYKPPSDTEPYDVCTFSKGYVTQPVYSCLTCLYVANVQEISQLSGMTTESMTRNLEASGATRIFGFCRPCSTVCHPGHVIVELANRRKFQCDCGQPSVNKCKFNDHALGKCENDYNRSRHNFIGLFCRCRSVSPPKDSTMMFQCILCEDWFHDCCMGELPDLDSFDDIICPMCADHSQAIPAEIISHLNKSHISKNSLGYYFAGTEWRSQCCRCLVCREFYLKNGICIHDEEDESGELATTSCLNHINSLEVLYAINDLRDNLKDFLKPFAEEKKIVTKNDIIDFFESHISKR